MSDIEFSDSESEEEFFRILDDIEFDSEDEEDFYDIYYDSGFDSNDGYSTDINEDIQRHFNPPE